MEIIEPLGEKLFVIRYYLTHCETELRELRDVGGSGDVSLYTKRRVGHGRNRDR